MRFLGQRPRMENRNKKKEEQTVMTCLDKTALSIRSRGMVQIPDGVKILVHDETDVDKILSDCCKKLLLEIGLEPFCSPQKAAQQTVVVRTRSALIHGATDEELRQEIKKQHPKIVISSIWKSEDRGIVKFQCRSLADAKKLKSCNLKLQGYTMRAEDLEEAEYINVTQCLKCYELDSHTSSRCQNEGTFCGECGAADHRHDECRNPEPGCINCIRALRPMEETKHKARSNFCPLKKKILQRKRDERNRDHSTRRGESTSRTAYSDAPPPAANAWGTDNRSQSRGRGRGASRGRKGRASVGRPPSAAAAAAAPDTPVQAPPTSESAYPDLAHNRQERREKNRRRGKNKQGNQQTATNAHEQQVRVSAPETAGYGVPAAQALNARAPAQHLQGPPQPMEVQEAPSAAASCARRIPPADQPCAINVILTACHQHNMVRPGEFEAKARFLLQKNLGISVDLGNEWHSAEYIRLISGAAPAVPDAPCNCKCQCRGAIPKTTTRVPQETVTARKETSPVIQPAPRPSPPPYPLTAEVIETIMLDMDTNTQGNKRMRNDSPDASPAEQTAAKRLNTVQPPTSPPVVTALSQECANELGDMLVTVPETGAVVTLASLQEELSLPQQEQTEKTQTNPLSPLSPDEVFADAEEEAESTTSAPKPGVGGMEGQDVTEIPPPASLMPPPPNPVKGRQRLRSSSTPRTPTKGDAPPRSPKKKTPLKRTTSQLTIADPLSSGPTFSQLDRALEEALESDSSVGSNSSRRGRKEKCRSRESRHSRSSSSRDPRHTEGSKMNPVTQCVIAAEVARSCVEITSDDGKILQKLKNNISKYKMADLIKLWRKGVIVLEVKPRIPTTNTPEPDWRRRKYEGITSTLYERKIDESEWLKYDGSLHLIVSAPRLVSASAMKKKVEDSQLRLKRSQELYKNGDDFVNWLYGCPSPPRKTINQSATAKSDSQRHKKQELSAAGSQSGAPKADSQEQDFFAADSQDAQLATASANPSGWTQDIPNSTTTRNTYTDCF